jgi:class 3 adenylate cyclase/tetratricopeptide (TPR) repeat protein
MKCPRCEHQNPQGARFCEECATPLARTCSNCGTALSATAKFCHACAHPVAVPANPLQRSPDSYTPKHLAEKILTSKAALEGERKQVTVLFADLKGSMELLADRDPEEARKVLDPVLELMMEAVHHYEGTVNQVMGDGIMALFGAPVAHEDHAVRACYAALRIQESVKQYAEEIRRRQGALVQVRVGLNSGEVVVRSIRSDLHMDYTAVGQTTHLAARMEQLAMPGSVLMTTDTRRLVDGFVDVKPLGPVNVKGLSEPVEVFEVAAGGPVRIRLQAAARRGLTRFVGRDAELEQLDRARQLAADGRGQLAAIVGEAGVGKSRLVYEFIRSGRVHGWLVLESASVSYGKATSFLPVIELLKTYFKIQDRDDIREVREKVAARLLTLDDSLGPALPALLALVGARVDDASWTALDPGQRRQRTLDAVRRLLLREAREQPLLLIFEDLHWIDGETQALLDSLVESLPTARLLLVINYRPEYRHGWGGKTYYRQVRVDPLLPQSADDLLDALLGRDGALGPLKRLLIDRTEANPLFLEETVWALVETGTLTGERGGYRLTRPIELLTIPATIQAILAARIDRLAPEAKRVLQAGAVIGKDVPMPLLLAIADAREEEVRAELARLQAAEFLYETRLFPDLEYTFKHVLTHEVAYQGLLREQQRVLHARITEAIERLWADRITEQAERLAQHALHGELWERAVDYLRIAASKAMSRSVSGDARAHLEQALSVLSRVPDSQAARAAAVDIRIDIQAALQPLGQGQEMLRYLSEAQPLAETLGDPLRLGRVSAHMAYCLWWVGQPESAIEAGRRALTIGSSCREPILEVEAAFRLGMAYFFSGALSEASTLFRRIIQLLQKDRAGETFGLPFLPAVFSRIYQGWASTCTGNFRPGRDTVEEALQIAESVDHPFTTVWAHVGIGLVRFGQGHVADALVALESSLALWRRGNWAFMFPWVAAPLGRAYAAAGRTEEAIELLKHSAEGTAAMNVMPLLVQNLAYLSEAYLLAGRYDDATASIGRALQLCRVHHQHLFEPDAVRIEGEILAHRTPQSDVTRAIDAYLAALSLAGDLRMRPLVAHCHLGLGKLYRRDKREQAREHLATATTMYREMEMTYWLEMATKEFETL